MLEISRELGPKEAMPALISVPESKQDAEATETSSAPPAAADAVATPPPAAAGTPVSNGGTDTADDAPPGKGEKGERHIDLHSSGDSVCGGRKRNASKFISVFFLSAHSHQDSSSHCCICSSGTNRCTACCCAFHRHVR